MVDVSPLALTLTEAVAAAKLSRSEIYRALQRGDLTATRSQRDRTCSQQQREASPLKRERAGPPQSSPPQICSTAACTMIALPLFVFNAFA
jgi:hypothetical protein